MRLIIPMIAFIGTLSVSTAVVLDGNTFFIYNKKYYFQKLAQWGTWSWDVGTHQNYYSDQLWTLKADQRKPGCYYIENVKYQGYKIAQSGDYDQGLGVYNGQRNDDQLWSFEPVGKYYKIRSCKYTNRVFSKWGSWDSSFGTHRDINAEDQLWDLKPRFEAKAVQTNIWAVDNRGGSKPFTETREVTQGLKLTQSSTISTKVNLEASLGFTIPIQMPINVGLAMKGEITKSLTRGSEKTWNTKSTITFTAPAGKNYRVTQFVVTFKSEIPGDEIALYTNYKVEETTGALPHLQSY